MEYREKIGIMEYWIDGILVNSGKVKSHEKCCAELDSVLIQHLAISGGP
jgi:hypothetical protein